MDYSSQKEWLDAWKKKKIKERMGNVPTWAEREGAAPIMTGHEYDKKVSDATKEAADRRAYLDAEEQMSPRSNYDDARQDLTDANLKTMGAFDKAQAGLGDILGHGRREAERFGIDELARREQEEKQTGFVSMGGTRTDPGQRRLNELDSRYAQQMMPVHFGRAKAHDAHGQQLANLSSRQADMDNAYTDQLTNRYYQQQQLDELQSRWEEEQKLKRLGTTTKETGIDKFGRPTGGRTTTSGFTNLGGKYSNSDYSNLLGRMG